MNRSSVRARLSGSGVGKVAFGILLGCVLGVVGLPRLELPMPRASFGLEAVLAVGPVVEAQVAPTPEPMQAGPSVKPTPTKATLASPPSLLVAEGFAAFSQWPNDPDGTAWLADGEYRLSARQPGNFVAVGVPLPRPVGDVMVAAQFHKLGGPPGGGYGLIVRDQSSPSERDGRNQGGTYLALAVSDRGDVGVWQRDQTHWIDVVPWTHLDVVHLDTDTNTLVVTSHGSALRFEVNGGLVAELSYDGVPSSGGVGIFVGGDLNEVALEWLRIEA